MIVWHPIPVKAAWGCAADNCQKHLSKVVKLFTLYSPRIGVNIINGADHILANSSNQLILLWISGVNTHQESIALPIGFQLPLLRDTDIKQSKGFTTQWSCSGLWGFMSGNIFPPTFFLHVESRWVYSSDLCSVRPPDRFNGSLGKPLCEVIRGKVQVNMSAIHNSSEMISHVQYIVASLGGTNISVFHQWLWYQDQQLVSFWVLQNTDCTSSHCFKLLYNYLSNHALYFIYLAWVLPCLNTYSAS